MKKFWEIIVWEWRLQFRHQIITVAAFVTILYTVIFSYLPDSGFDTVVMALIFSDPAMLGFMFVGVLVIFEKGANTLQALVVTPIRPWQYLWAKTISLTTIALPCSFVMGWVGHAGTVNFFWLGLGVIYASFMFVMVGFIGVSRVKTINQYLIIIPIFLTPLILPLLNLVELTHSYFLYLIPSQGSLSLFSLAFGNALPDWELGYAIIYPLPWIYVFYQQAVSAYQTHIISSN